MSSGTHGSSSPPPAGDDDAGGGAAPRKPFLLRLPPELMAELKGWSAQEFRSVNAHIEYLLRAALKQRKGGPPTEDAP